MINLLPSDEKIALRRLYRRHLVLVALTLILFLIIFSTVTLLPSYFIFSGRHGQLAKRLDDTEMRLYQAGTSELLEIVKSVSAKLSILSEPQRRVKAAPVISILVADAKNLVSLDFFSLGSAGEVSISGLAPSRQKLLTFIEALESEALFREVDSPISNLIAVRDINFRINLLVATSSQSDRNR